eukprot:4293717-Amphidinium_carterae.3
MVHYVSLSIEGVVAAMKRAISSASIIAGTWPTSLPTTAEVLNALRHRLCHCVMLLLFQPEWQSILSQAHICAGDGMPLQWAHTCVRVLLSAAQDRGFIVPEALHTTRRAHQPAHCRKRLLSEFGHIKRTDEWCFSFSKDLKVRVGVLRAPQEFFHQANLGGCTEGGSLQQVDSFAEGGSDEETLALSRLSGRSGRNCKTKSVPSRGLCHDSLDPGVRGVLKERQVLLLEHCLKCIGYSDRAAVGRSLVEGVDLTSPVNFSKEFPAKFMPATIT